MRNNILLVFSYFGKLEEESKELEKLVMLIFSGWEASLKRSRTRYTENVNIMLKALHSMFNCFCSVSGCQHLF